jgi:capsule polysaccharide export protein KpsE/RkpR
MKQALYNSGDFSISFLYTDDKIIRVKNPCSAVSSASGMLYLLSGSASTARIHILRTFGESRQMLDTETMYFKLQIMDALLVR